MPEILRPAFEQQETEPPLSEKLKAVMESCEIQTLPIQGIKGLENLEGKDVFLISVTDKDKWQTPEEAKKLLPYFGQIVFNQYEPRINPRQYDPTDPKIAAEALSDIYECDPGQAERLIVIADQGKVIGFTAYEFLDSPDGQKIIEDGLTMVDLPYENQSYNKQLNRLLFSSEQPDAVISWSATPAAVKNLINIGQEFDYDTYFCGYKNGQFGDTGSAEESAKVKELNQHITKEGKKWNGLEVPYGYFIYGHPYEVMSPLQESSIKFPAGHPLDETFRKGVLAQQAKLDSQEKPGPGTVFGNLITIKKSVD